MAEREGGGRNLNFHHAIKQTITNPLKKDTSPKKIDYESMWNELKLWVEKEQTDMLTNPNRTEMYYSGIACQTSYIKGKMNELEQKK